jgi:hypothetical protein
MLLTTAASAHWKPIYAQLPQEQQDWFKEQTVPGTQYKCCSADALERALAYQSQMTSSMRVTPASGGPVMRTRAYRRHQTARHLRRRLSEDRNQRYNDLSCPRWSDPKVMARFKEQPQACSCMSCCNQRRWYGRTMQELRADWV